MDIYPNDGSAFDVPVVDEAQLQAESDEKYKVEKSYPILDELIATLKTDMLSADSMQALGIDSSTPAVQVQIIREGSTKFYALLAGEISILEELRDRYRTV